MLVPVGNEQFPVLRVAGTSWEPQWSSMEPPPLTIDVRAASAPHCRPAGAVPSAGRHDVGRNGAAYLAFNRGPAFAQSCQGLGRVGRFMVGRMAVHYSASGSRRTVGLVYTVPCRRPAPRVRMPMAFLCHGLDARRSSSTRRLLSARPCARLGRPAPRTAIPAAAGIRCTSRAGLFRAEGSLLPCLRSRSLRPCQIPGSAL